MAGAAVVTGGTGFVGANLVRRLVGEGHETHLLVRPECDRWRLADLEHDVQWHVVAIEDEEGTAAAVSSIGPRWVFHLAAHGAYSSQRDVRAMVSTNVMGTVNLVEAAIRTGVESLVHTGSSSEYGFKDRPPGEEAWLEPNSAYAVTKASATLYCRHAAAAHTAPIVTLRLYSVYGPWEEPTRLMPALALSGREGRLPPLVDPSIARDFIHVDDVVDAMLLTARSGMAASGAVYNVGTGRQTTIGELVAIVRGHFCLDLEPEWGSFPKRDWDTAIWQADPQRIRAELGWVPRLDVGTGFGRFAAWLDGPHGLPYRSRALVGAGASSGRGARTDK